MRRAALLLVLGTALSARAQSDSLVIDGVPPIPAAVYQRLNQYSNTRGAHLFDWDPTGRSLLVGTRFGETQQVHVVAAPGGAREQLTFFHEPVADAASDPARSGGFYFLRDAGGAEHYQIYWYDLASGKESLLTDGKSRNTSLTVSNRGGRIAFLSTLRNGKDYDLYLGGSRPGSARRVKELEGGWGVVDWSPDDTHLLLQKWVSANESYLYVYDLASGGLTEVNPQHGHKRIAYAGGGFLRGGRAVIYASDEDAEVQRLTRYDLASGRKELLAPGFAWDVERVAVSPNRAWLAYEVNEGGRSALYVAPAARPRAAWKVALEPGVLTGLRFDRKGRRLALSMSTSTSAEDAYTVDLATHKLTRWTHSELGGLPRRMFVEPKLIDYPSFDGRRIPAWVYRPRGVAKAPVIILFHGGPESQYRPRFSATVQAWVNELGAAVIAPNVRGSAGYGKSYLLMDNGMKRGDAIKDVGALLDWIAAQPDLDARRVAVFGGSYGGFMVLASLYSYPDRVRCGVDYVGISNFVTFLEHTQEYRRDLRRPEYGDERDPKMRAFLERISPTTNAARIKSALLVLQGANDPRVPASEAQQIVKTVRAAGTPVWFALAKDEGHGFRKKSNRDFALASTHLFYEQFLLK